MDLLKKRYMRTNINANKVYNEYIHAPTKDYVHLNSTKWTTLTAFIMNCRDKGLIKIIQPQLNSFLIRYINPLDKTDQEIQREKEEQTQRKNQEQAREIKKLMKKATQLRKIEASRDREDERVKYQKESDSEVYGQIEFKIQGDDDDDNDRLSEWNTFKLYKEEQLKEKKRKFGIQQKKYFNSSKKREQTKNSVIDLLLQNKKKTYKVQQTVQQTNQAPWIKQGMVVKIMDQSVSNGKYYKKLGKIIEIAQDDFVATVKLIDFNTKLILDQYYLEKINS